MRHRFLVPHLRLPVGLLVGLALASLSACASPPTALDADAPVVRQDDRGLALEGFDPVAYQLEGQARRGLAERTAEHGGATYRFASEDHRTRFLAEPERYAPAYGGWCAWAVADGEGSLVEVDPRSFLVRDGRLLLFYDGAFADTRAWWEAEDEQALMAAAERNWARITAGRSAPSRP